MMYKGPPGTRWGVERALAQKWGRCWDFSDVFITLARAAGIPARQVYGWIGPSGHVWAEVFDGRAWIQVDPTASWTGVSEDYIPLAHCATGRMPFVYWGKPLTEALRGR
jgi:transglutaminase-like putative cysteine protease